MRDGPEAASSILKAARAASGLSSSAEEDFKDSFGLLAVSFIHISLSATVKVLKICAAGFGRGKSL